MYFLSIKSLSPVTTTIQIRAEMCNSFNASGGPGCAIPYNNSGVYNLNVMSVYGVYNYWSLSLPAATTTTVSILPNNYDIWNYELFASKGQLPQLANADISDCYAPSCEAVLSMSITTGSSNELWFISVLPYTTNKTYAIWFNTTCAPGCDQYGSSCINTGPNIGLCACTVESTGAACHLLNTKRAHTIVLIIIGSLFLLSTLIGLGFSWYMKRHKGYQAV